MNSGNLERIVGTMMDGNKREGTTRHAGFTHMMNGMRDVMGQWMVVLAMLLALTGSGRAQTNWIEVSGLPAPRANGTSGVANVSFQTRNGTAAAGTDYTATDGTIIWPIPQPPAWVAASYDFYIDRVRVTWDADDSAFGYKVWRGASNDTRLATNISSGITGTSYDDMAATPGTPYYYWVTTFNPEGDSAFSASDLGRVLLGPDVLVNDEVVPVTVTTGSQVVVTVSMGLGQYAAVPRDWWLTASTSFGLYYLNSSLAWVRASDLSTLQPVYQGGLFGLQSAVALDTTELPSGTYEFYFGVDTLNGILDPDVIYDSATVIVEP